MFPLKKFKFSDDTCSIKTLEFPLCYGGHDTTVSTILSVDESGIDTVCSADSMEEVLVGVEEPHPQHHSTEDMMVIVDRNWLALMATPPADTTGSSGYGSYYGYTSSSITAKQKDLLKRSSSLPCLLDKEEQPGLQRSTSSLSLSCQCPLSSSQSSFCYKCHSPIKTSFQHKSLYQDDKGYFRVSLNQKN